MVATARATNKAEISWKDFKERIEAVYSPVNVKQLARDQLAQLVQVGTVADYVMQFQTLWCALPSMTDEEAKDHFERGLQPIICAEVCFRFPATTNDLM